MPHAPPSLPQLTAHALAACAPTPLLVGYSGGRDSSVLLHVLAGLQAARARGLRAIHVDHGMHPDAARWAQHCRDTCAALDVPLTVVRVQVAKDTGSGPEAAARHARYAAFEQALGEGERLVLAQHRDDQAETFLLKALRGSGPQGLAAMRSLRRLGRGWLWRPWLEVPRAAIRDHAEAEAIACIDDPANADPELARSFLRSEIMPRLRRHWPQADRTLALSAAACRDAGDYLDIDLEDTLHRLRAGDPDSLDADGWLALHPALRAPLLHRWLHARGLPVPNIAQRRELERQLTDAGPDRLPQVAWPGAELRLWRGRLHAMAPLPAPPAGWRQAWDGAPLPLPGGGSLSLSVAAVRCEPPLELQLRAGGERLRPAGKPHTRELRDLFQEAPLAPWLRPFCPLLYQDGRLLAVADLYASDEGERLFERLGARPFWRRPGGNGD